MTKTITAHRPVTFKRSVDVQPTPEAERKDPMQVPRPATPMSQISSRHAKKPSETSTFEDDSVHERAPRWLVKVKLWLKGRWGAGKTPGAK